MKASINRARNFAAELKINIPILLAPMAGACPPSLSVAVAKAGGMGACGVLLMRPEEIAAWVAEFRSAGVDALQLNVWTPDPAPARDADHEKRVRDFLAQWGPEAAETAGDATPLDFKAQCDAMLSAQPTAISSIMGIFDSNYVRQLKAAGVKWFATATTVAEAVAARDAGADAIIAQGAEAGGHRGAFDPAYAIGAQVGLFALLPAIVDAVDIPVVAAGGIADARGVAAALTLGASAAMIGTGFLRCPEAKIAPVWADALGRTQPEDTMITRAFSGRPGRSLATDYVRAAASPDTPSPAPYPVQRGLTAPMRSNAAKRNNLAGMQAWSGQAARLAPAVPAGDFLVALWRETEDMLS